MCSALLYGYRMPNQIYNITYFNRICIRIRLLNLSQPGLLGRSLIGGSY